MTTYTTTLRLDGRSTVIAPDGRDCFPKGFIRSEVAAQVAIELSSASQVAAISHAGAATYSRAAVDTLEGMGYTWQGGVLWRPPIGKPPGFHEAKAKCQEQLQRYVDDDLARETALAALPAQAVAPACPLVGLSGHDDLCRRCAGSALAAPVQDVAPTSRELDMAMLIRRIVISARRNCEDGSNVLTLANSAADYLRRAGLDGSPLRDGGIESDPVPKDVAPTDAREGWQLVPKDPTKAMRRAGADVWATQSGHVAQVTGSMYRAMLAAAPQAAQPAAQPADAQAMKGVPGK